MTKISHYDMMQKIFKKDSSIAELDIIIMSYQEQATEAHEQGAYTTAKQLMLTASLARQLKELKEEKNHEK